MPGELTQFRDFYRCALSLICVCATAAVVGASMLAEAATGKPTLLSEATSTRAIALESVTQKREPFPLTATVAFSLDSRTRITIFAIDLYMFSGEAVSAFKVDAEDAAHRHYSLPVEFVGPVPGFEGITEIVVRLSDDISEVGDVLVGLTLHGIATNRVRLGIGHVGGGPNNDPGAIPTPAPQTPRAGVARDQAADLSDASHERP